MKQLRRCLARFATGVTVVSCRDPSGAALGVTVNSFSSVSLDPPLIQWNLGKTSQSLAAFLDAAHFAVNVLGYQQRPLAEHFAKSEKALFDGIAHRYSPRDVPLLPDTLAWLECRARESHACGDHFIIIGEVLDFRTGEGEPLLFFDGRYCKLPPADGRTGGDRSLRRKPDA